MTPLVSIILPFLNAGPYLAEAIASVEAQSEADWELLLIDDGSTDASPVIATRAAAADPRIRLITRPADNSGGAAAARNLGLREARGAFIAFLDADDLYEPGKLASQLAPFREHPEIMIVYGPTRWWHPGAEHRDWTERMRPLARRVHKAPELLNRVLLMQRGHVPCTCGVLIRREALKMVGGFDEAFALYEDQTLWAKLLLRFPAYVTDLVCARYRQHGGSATARSEQSGAYDRLRPHQARIAFLNWVRDHARASGLADPSVERALRLAFAPYGERTALSRAERLTLLRYALDNRLRSIFRRLGRLPRRIRQLWSPGRGPVRVLVEPSDYVLRNVGDMAMLHVATERLAGLWPGATIKVLTDEPGPLSCFCPSATPLPAEGRALWLQPDFLPGPLARRLPDDWPKWIRRSAPWSVALFWRAKLWWKAPLRAALAQFTDAVDEADLVIVSGMGGITDYFPKYAEGVLETLNLALARKRPVVMVGQGMGPLEDDPELRARAAAILPRLDLIAIREKRASAPLLLALGVAPDRIAVTGDDAIEMAFALREATLGEGIGVNLRLSDYSEVGPALLDELAQVLADASARLGGSLLPVPVSHVPGEADLDAIRRLMPGEGAELAHAEGLRTPIDLIRQIQRCRVVMTGSYHAGVFALANGIPTIGLAKSAYYVDKFLGLADMFGSGCEVVRLDQQDHPEALRRALDRLWHAAPEIRPALLASAEQQIAAGHAAYRRIFDLVTARRRN
jgi:glycosyltransferase involved in cell wall biosynthesis/polysaccharide pyruvyl transferase WcaK-like protein